VEINENNGKNKKNKKMLSPMNDGNTTANMMTDNDMVADKNNLMADNNDKPQSARE